MLAMCDEKEEMGEEGDVFDSEEGDEEENPKGFIYVEGDEDEEGEEDEDEEEEEVKPPPKKSVKRQNKQKIPFTKKVSRVNFKSNKCKLRRVAHSFTIHDKVYMR